MVLSKRVGEGRPFAGVRSFEGIKAQTRSSLNRSNTLLKKIEKVNRKRRAKEIVPVLEHGEGNENLRKIGRWFQEVEELDDLMADEYRTAGIDLKKIGEFYEGLAEKGYSINSNIITTYEFTNGRKPQKEAHTPIADSLWEIVRTMSEVPNYKKEVKEKLAELKGLRKKYGYDDYYSILASVLPHLPAIIMAAPQSYDGDYDLEPDFDRIFEDHDKIPTDGGTELPDHIFDEQVEHHETTPVEDDWLSGLTEDDELSDYEESELEDLEDELEREKIAYEKGKRDGKIPFGGGLEEDSEETKNMFNTLLVAAIMVGGVAAAYLASNAGDNPDGNGGGVITDYDPAILISQDIQDNVPDYSEVTADSHPASITIGNNSLYLVENINNSAYFAGSIIDGVSYIDPLLTNWNGELEDLSNFELGDEFLENLSEKAKEVAVREGLREDLITGNIRGVSWDTDVTKDPSNIQKHKGPYAKGSIRVWFIPQEAFDNGSVTPEPEENGSLIVDPDGYSYFIHDFYDIPQITSDPFFCPDNVLGIEVLDAFQNESEWMIVSKDGIPIGNYEVNGGLDWAGDVQHFVDNNPGARKFFNESLEEAYERAVMQGVIDEGNFEDFQGVKKPVLYLVRNGDSVESFANFEELAGHYTLDDQVDYANISVDAQQEVVQRPTEMFNKTFLTYNQYQDAIAQGAVFQHQELDLGKLEFRQEDQAVAMADAKATLQRLKAEEEAYERLADIFGQDAAQNGSISGGYIDGIQYVPNGTHYDLKANLSIDSGLKGGRLMHMIQSVIGSDVYLFMWLDTRNDTLHDNDFILQFTGNISYDGQIYTPQSLFGKFSSQIGGKLNEFLAYVANPSQAYSVANKDQEAGEYRPLILPYDTGADRTYEALEVFP